MIKQIELAIYCIDNGQPEMARAILCSLMDEQRVVDWEELNKQEKERMERLDKLIPKFLESA